MADDKIDYIAQRLDTVAKKVSEMNDTLQVHVGKFDTHLENVAERQEELKRNTDILHKNTVSLENHIKRTDLLEQYVKSIDERFTPVEMGQLKDRAVSEWIKAKII